MEGSELITIVDSSLQYLFSESVFMKSSITSILFAGIFISNIAQAEVVIEPLMRLSLGYDFPPSDKTSAKPNTDSDHLSVSSDATTLGDRVPLLGKDKFPTLEVMLGMRGTIHRQRAIWGLFRIGSPSVARDLSSGIKIGRVEAGINYRRIMTPDLLIGGYIAGEAFIPYTYGEKPLGYLFNRKEQIWKIHGGADFIALPLLSQITYPLQITIGGHYTYSGLESNLSKKLIAYDRGGGTLRIAGDYSSQVKMFGIGYYRYHGGKIADRSDIKHNGGGGIGVEYRLGILAVTGKFYKDYHSGCHINLTLRIDNFGGQKSESLLQSYLKRDIPLDDIAPITFLKQLPRSGEIPQRDETAMDSGDVEVASVVGQQDGSYWDNDDATSANESIANVSVSDFSELNVLDPSINVTTPNKPLSQAKRQYLLDAGHSKHISPPSRVPGSKPQEGNIIDHLLHDQALKATRGWRTLYDRDLLLEKDLCSGLRWLLGYYFKVESLQTSLAELLGNGHRQLAHYPEHLRGENKALKVRLREARKKIETIKEVYKGRLPSLVGNSLPKKATLVPRVKTSPFKDLLGEKDNQAILMSLYKKYFKGEASDLRDENSNLPNSEKLLALLLENEIVALYPRDYATLISIELSDPELSKQARRILQALEQGAPKIGSIPIEVVPDDSSHGDKGKKPTYIAMRKAPIPGSVHTMSTDTIPSSRNKPKSRHKHKLGKFLGFPINRVHRQLPSVPTQASGKRLLPGNNRLIDGDSPPPITYPLEASGSLIGPRLADGSSTHLGDEVFSNDLSLASSGGGEPSSTFPKAHRVPIAAYIGPPVERHALPPSEYLVSSESGNNSWNTPAEIEAGPAIKALPGPSTSAVIGLSPPVISRPQGISACLKGLLSLRTELQQSQLTADRAWDRVKEAVETKDGWREVIQAVKRRFPSGERTIENLLGVLSQHAFFSEEEQTCLVNIAIILFSEEDGDESELGSEGGYEGGETTHQVPMSALMSRSSTLVARSSEGLSTPPKEYSGSSSVAPTFVGHDGLIEGSVQTKRYPGGRQGSGWTKEVSYRPLKEEEAVDLGDVNTLVAVQKQPKQTWEEVKGSLLDGFAVDLIDRGVLSDKDRNRNPTGKVRAIGGKQASLTSMEKEKLQGIQDAYDMHLLEQACRELGDKVLEWVKAERILPEEISNKVVSMPTRIAGMREAVKELCKPEIQTRWEYDKAFTDTLKALEIVLEKCPAIVNPRPSLSDNVRDKVTLKERQGREKRRSAVKTGRDPTPHPSSSVVVSSSSVQRVAQNGNVSWDDIRQLESLEIFGTLNEALKALELIEKRWIDEGKIEKAMPTFSPLIRKMQENPSWLNREEESRLSDFKRAHRIHNVQRDIRDELRRMYHGKFPGQDGGKVSELRSRQLVERLQPLSLLEEEQDAVKKMLAVLEIGEPNRGSASYGRGRASSHQHRDKSRPRAHSRGGRSDRGGGSIVSSSQRRDKSRPRAHSEGQKHNDARSVVSQSDRPKGFLGSLAKALS